MAEELGRHDVERLAQLARLRLTDAETGQFAGQLARILAYADTVRLADTSDVRPTSHPFAEPAEHVREDEVRPSLARDEVMRTAPDADPAAGLFRVPRVL